MKPKIKAVLFPLTAALTIAGGSMSANLTAEKAPTQDGSRGSWISSTAPDKAPTQDGSRGAWAG
ncbi:hypothetical protein [Deinococcus puniceus]|uniref:hypothetical protein n=1 Tax=Deinococcus puniceus TaxID=1182568 RepID=UPI000A775A01|nr:hypothetical protein [Deinococcus puniceus]